MIGAVRRILLSLLELLRRHADLIHACRLTQCDVSPRLELSEQLSAGSPVKGQVHNLPQLCRLGGHNCLNQHRECNPFRSLAIPLALPLVAAHDQVHTASSFLTDLFLVPMRHARSSRIYLIPGYLGICPSNLESCEVTKVAAALLCQYQALYLHGKW